MQQMDTAQWVAFVNEGTRTGKLGVVRADGSPHVAPVWFEVSEDGTELVFFTGSDTVKGRAIERDPRICLCVDSEVAPFSFVQINAVAKTQPCDDATLPLAIKIGARYMGAEKGEQYGRRNNVDGEILVRAQITKVIALAGVAD